MKAELLGEELQSLVAGTVKPGEPMCYHTTWKIGGPADIFVDPAGIKDLQTVLSFARQKGLPVTVVGNGSNLLVTDKGIRGIVVHIGRGFDFVRADGVRVLAGAGTKLGRLVALARREGIGGFEFLAGIPGTVGGALVMNAGAHGFHISELVQEITAVDYDGQLLRLGPEDLEFGYRSSRLQTMPVIAVQVELAGVRKESEEIEHKVREFLTKRQHSQPLDYPNAGSVFKNPPGDSAGRIIELAGCKGLRVGDAEVSTKHANFFINRGSATAREMLELIEKVRQLVAEKFDIDLSLEVQVVGDL